MSKVTYLKDYKVPTHNVESVRLKFDLFDDHTLVTNVAKYAHNPESKEHHLSLNGHQLELVSVKLNGAAFAEYSVTEDGLRIDKTPAHFELEVVTKIHPEKNTSLEGLYKSSGLYCTQMESEGFRKVTFFQDRPDVMTVYTVTITADKKKLPVLLSNGNLIDQKDLADGRHSATWNDPFKKPCYLFALVAGDLDVLKDEFTTRSGRKVDLRVYTDRGLVDRCHHAMQSLKRSMKWDEEAYGREYDLDLFMIVAVKDFNFGAMENKGLNIFTAGLVYADPKTTVDAYYHAIEAVVGHEYFHNWSGNRVTCRDWFQLCLKEGFTVFRDQSFSEAMHSAGVQRLEQASDLIAGQFPEDAGPLAHPIRPQSFVTIDNFYTSTVYSKGAEVIRMLHTLLGAESFRKGTDLYFERNDGRAATTDDFLSAMQAVTSRDLKQFGLWYEYAGTPEVTVTAKADGAAYVLSFKQSNRDTPENSNKKPMHIPVRLALFDRNTKRMIPKTEQVFDLTQAEQALRFEGVTAQNVIPSLLRGFSAPVNLRFEWTPDELSFLAAVESDPFSRWQALRQLRLEGYRAALAGEIQKYELYSKALGNALGVVLERWSEDPELTAQLLEFPSLADCLNALGPVKDFHKFEKTYRDLRAQPMILFGDRIKSIYLELKNKGQSNDFFDARSVGERTLRNCLLGLYTAKPDPQFATIAFDQLKSAPNMTDELSALAALARTPSETSQKGVQLFFEKWKGEDLVLDKWFSVQALDESDDITSRITTLSVHPSFDWINPSRLYALFGTFARSNAKFYTQPGLRLMADAILKVDPKNSHASGSLVRSFRNLRLVDEPLRQLMRAELERIAQTPGLSKGLGEMVTKLLS